MLPRPGNSGEDNPDFHVGFGQDVDFVTSAHLKNVSVIPKAL